MLNLDDVYDVLVQECEALEDEREPIKAKLDGQDHGRSDNDG